MGRYRDDRYGERGTLDRGADEVRSWFGDDDAERRGRRYDDDRDIQEYVRDESGLEPLELLGRGAGYGVSGAADRFAGTAREADYDETSGYQHRYRSTTSGFGPDRRADLRANPTYEDPWADRYSRGPQGHLYGQHTGFGVPVDRLSGRWEETVSSSTAGEYTGRGPRGYRRSDDRIREEIADRLTDDPWIDPSDVEVTVAEGRVALSGTVEDRKVKYAVEDLVESVAGVTDVENRIRVRR